MKLNWFLREMHREGVVYFQRSFTNSLSLSLKSSGPWLMGVRVILAESFNPAYEKSLVQIGILPLRLVGENARNLGITGREAFSFEFEEEEVKGVEKEENTDSDSRRVSHLVRVRLDNGSDFQAEMRFHSEETLGRVLDEGFFARSAKRLLSSSV